MGDVIELEDNLTYIVDDDTGKFVGVQWLKMPTYLTIGLDGSIDCIMLKTSTIPPHELRQLFIMWLALAHPDCLNFDVAESEDQIRNDTK